MIKKLAFNWNINLKVVELKESDIFQGFNSTLENNTRLLGSVVSFSLIFDTLSFADILSFSYRYNGFKIITFDLVLNFNLNNELTFMKSSNKIILHNDENLIFIMLLNILANQ